MSKGVSNQASDSPNLVSKALDVQGRYYAVRPLDQRKTTTGALDGSISELRTVTRHCSSLSRHTHGYETRPVAEREQISVLGGFYGPVFRISKGTT
jgi:hypothetical protein